MAIAVLQLGCHADELPTALKPAVVDSSVPPRYDLREHAKQYLVSSWSPEALGVSLFSASLSSSIRMIPSNSSLRSYYERTAGNMARNVISRSFEFVTSALIEHNEQFTPSPEHGFRRRAEYAAYRAFFIRRGDQDELAYSRLAAAVGTAGLTALWHPWQRRQPVVWSEAGCILGRYLLRSYWVEFKPDIKRETRKLFHRDGLIATN